MGVLAFPPDRAASRGFLSFDSHRGRTAVVLLVAFVYMLVIRTRNITEIFELLGDQILYWNMALRPWYEQPLGGGPSSAGGTTIGPAFIWTMWGIRHVVGPWTTYLPHAGGIGLSIIQSVADVLFLAAIWKRFDSLALALATTLFLATGPEDMSLSASIWNPPLAVAFVKMSMAFVISNDRGTSLWKAAAATAAAILAVQVHSSAIFFAAPAIVSLIGRDVLAGRRARAVRVAGASIAVILLLEAPYIIDRALHMEKQASPGIVVASVSYTITHPATLRLGAAYSALATACQALLIRPWTFAQFGLLLAAAAMVAVITMRKDLSLLGATVLPLGAVVLGFSFWQQAFQYYWYMTMMPSVALTIGLALTAWKPAAMPAAAVFLAAVVAAQPARFRDAQVINRLRTYGVLVRGSQEIRRRTAEIRSIDIEFPVEPSTEKHYVYERVLHGRVTPTAAFAATIRRSGEVEFRLVSH